MSYQLSELQETWLQALESGEYAQTRAVLHDGKGFCCLGVACVVAGIPPVTDACGRFSYDGSWEAAPESVVEALRLRGENGETEGFFEAGGEQYHMLTSANDNGATFAEIAAAIRANPENFFLPTKDKGGE